MAVQTVLVCEAQVPFVHGGAEFLVRDLVRELLGVDLSKNEQSSDWGADELTEAQLRDSIRGRSIATPYLLEVTRATSPCYKIAASFEAGDFARVSQKRHPGWSRLYARVVVEVERDLQPVDRLADLGPVARRVHLERRG